jgi:predicted HicB family RNase H-like nuclease
MNTLKYKGYIGSVSYSEPDKVFFGKIEGIDGLVNYEGESVQELTTAFQEAVDDYLIFCEEHNCKPEKSYTGTFNIRISPATHRQIANLATEAGISINAFVRKALDEAVQQPGPAMLMEAESPHYGTSEEIRLDIPRKDIAFLKDLAARMEWKIN